MGGDKTTTTITLYYTTDGSSYRTIGTLTSSNIEGNFGEGGTAVTLWTRSINTSLDPNDDSSEDDDDDDSSSSSYELDLSAYQGAGYVYWDMNDSNNTMYTSTYSTYISSVTLKSKDYSGASTQEVNNYDSTSSTFDDGEGNEDNFTWDTTTAQLKRVYLDGDGETIADGNPDADTDAEEATATLTITPADGYYVTEVLIVCAAYVEPTDTRISPYQCTTYLEGNAYDGSFVLSSTTDAALALSVDIGNEYFSHNGYNNYTYGETSDDTAPVVYFILIEVAEVPTPAYVEYDYGDIVSNITAYNEENNTSLTSTSFSTAKGWTDASTSNVYSDSSSTSGTYTTNGGMMTSSTQFEYIFDKTGTTLNKNWKHYANTISDAAVAEAAAAGYVFAGWAVSYYTSAEVIEASSGSYNSYKISFSGYTISTLEAAGDEVVVSGYVRLVAQWVKAEDITQVIDYGLPVNTDVLDRGEYTIKAITGDVSSRTSTSDSYSNVTTKELGVTKTVAYAVSNSDTETTGTSSATTTNGDYGIFTISEKDEAIYTLTSELTGIEEARYQVTLTYGSGDDEVTLCTVDGGLSIIPATSIYYEESFGVTYGTYKVTSTGKSYTTVRSDAGGTSGDTTSTGSGGLIDYYWGAAFWVLTGSVEDNTQETGIVGTTNDSTYGADTYYYSNTNDSNGSSMYVDTSNNAAQFTYTFTGTGTAIYTRTLDDNDDQEGAYIKVTIADSSGGVEVEAFIDTRIVDNVSGSSVLYNIPIYSTTELDYGTYTVTVLVCSEGTPVQPTYVTKSDSGYSGDLEQAVQAETDEDDKETTYYLYYVYQDSDCENQLYYQVDEETGEVDYTKTGTTVTDYPVYYKSTGSSLTSYSETVDGTTTTYYLSALYFLADDTSGGDFYLDGIRIYNPLGTSEGNVSDSDKEDTTWSTASAAYAEDDEANNQVVNITQELEAQYDEGYTSSETFVTLTDYYGKISSAAYTADHPNNEIYLDSSGDSTTYSISFYLAVSSSDVSDYDFYIGLKAPDGTTGTVSINGETVNVKGSADCYYKLDDYLGDATSVTVGDSTVSAYEVTISGSSGLIALTYIKVTGEDEFTLVYSPSETSTDKTSEDNGSAQDGTTSAALLSTADASDEESVDTVYILSAVAVEADDTATDEDMLDDDDMAVPEEEPDTEDEEDSESETEEDAVFVPETFEASISYLRMLRYASITVKTSSDVSYITVNGTAVTGRSYGSSGAKTFSYTASRVSYGTTYEVIAYDADGNASEAVTLIAQ